MTRTKPMKKFDFSGWTPSRILLALVAIVLLVGAAILAPSVFKSANDCYDNGGGIEVQGECVTPAPVPTDSEGQ